MKKECSRCNRNSGSVDDMDSGRYDSKGCGISRRMGDRKGEWKGGSVISGSKVSHFQVYFMNFHWFLAKCGYCTRSEDYKNQCG